MPILPGQFLAPFLQPTSTAAVQGLQFGENVRRFQAGQPLRKLQEQQAQLQVDQQKQAQALFHQFMGGPPEGQFGTALPIEKINELLSTGLGRYALEAGTGIKPGKPTETEAEKLSLFRQKEEIKGEFKQPRETEEQKLSLFQKKEDIKLKGAGPRARAVLEATGPIKERQAVSQIEATTRPLVSKALEMEKTVGKLRAKNQAEAFIARLEAQEKTRRDRPPTGREASEVGLDLQDIIFKMTEGYTEELRSDDMAALNNKAKFYGLKVHPFVNEDTFPDTKTWRVLPINPSHPDTVTKMSEALIFYMQLFGLEEWEARLYLKELSGS